MTSSPSTRLSSAVVEIDPQDAVALSEPVHQALGGLARAFEQKGLPLHLATGGAEPVEGVQRLIIAGAAAPAGASMEARAGPAQEMRDPGYGLWSSDKS